MIPRQAQYVTFQSQNGEAVDESRDRAARSELARARLRLGMSQEEAAEAVGVSPTTWSRWECGGQKLRPVYRARIAEVFNADPITVEGWLDNKTATETTLFPITDFGGISGAVTVESFEHLWRCDVDPSRRHTLTAIPFVPVALSEWLSAVYDTPSTLLNHAGSSTVVGRADVARINEAWQAFTLMDHQFGSGLVRPAIVDYLNTTVAPLLRGRYDSRVGAELMVAAAGMTWMAGWTAFDLTHHGQAQHYFGQALRLARAADDSLTVAWVLTTLARQAIYLENPKWGIRLSRAAIDTAREGQAPPRMMALLLIRHAWAVAIRANPTQTGDRNTAKQVELLISEAEEAYTRGATDRDPAWIRSWETVEMIAEIGCCWRLLGQYRRAAVCAETALTELDRHRIRSVQFNCVNAAEAYLGMGDLEHAVASARGAIPLTKALTSARSTKYIYGFADQLKPYSKTIQVREFQAYLTAELTAA